jgi:hypothetical protein
MALKNIISACKTSYEWYSVIGNTLPNGKIVIPPINEEKNY